jgi:hypothetical protein
MGPSLRFLASRAGRLAALAGACACGAALWACITAPPPSAPSLAKCRPSILHTSVSPPADEILTAWPPGDTVLVPITIQSCNPTDGFHTNAFIDYDPVFNPGPDYASGTTPFALNGEPTNVEVTLHQLPRDLACHRVEILVAHDFNRDPSEPHVPDAFGGDSVTWFYSPSGGLNGCPQYDAGDGSSPADASGETPLFHGDGGLE